MSFVDHYYSPSKKEINDAENIAFIVLDKLIGNMDENNERNSFYKNEIKNNYEIMKSKMKEEKKRIRCDDYSLRHMVDIADVFRAMIRCKSENNEIHCYLSYKYNQMERI